MAIPWIKIETSLPRKPEVMQLAAILDIDEFAVVGHLVCFWSWVDENLSLECPVVTGTKRGLDRVAGRDGFADAMVTVGWLQMEGSAVSIPHLEYHLDQGAKTRAMEQRKKAKQRKNTGKPNVSGKCPDVIGTKTGTTAGPEERRGEKNRNKETHSVSADTEILFENFWSSYPRKTGKGGARKAFLKAIKTHEPEKIIQGAKQFSSTNKSDPEFTPHPATWLNQERWADEPLEPPKKKYQPFAWQEEQERRLRDGEITQAQFNAIILAKMHERD